MLIKMKESGGRGGDGLFTRMLRVIEQIYFIHAAIQLLRLLKVNKLNHHGVGEMLVKRQESFPVVTYKPISRSGNPVR